MTTMMRAACLSSGRVTRVERYHSITRSRLTSDEASLGWIVNDNEIAAPSGQRPTDRGGIATSRGVVWISLSVSRVRIIFGKTACSWDP